eukprot:8821038-Alexandrium_andersonii.AAC.1
MSALATLQRWLRPQASDSGTPRARLPKRCIRVNQPCCAAQAPRRQQGQSGADLQILPLPLAAGRLR